MNILDSHVHFWNYDKQNPEFEWIGEGMEKIQKSFLPVDYLEQVRSSEFVVRSKKNNFSNYSDKANDYQLPTINYGLIAVQAAETWQETEFLLDLASKHDFIKGVVGWVEFENGSEFKVNSKHKQSQTNNYKLQTNNYKLQTNNYELQTNNYELLKGFRHIIQAKPHGFMSDDKFRYFISKLRNQNYTYDLLLKTHQLEEALDLVQDFPNQKFVIDHLAKPDSRNQDIEQWKSHIQEFKHLPNVYCKLSGMVTEAYWNNWTQEDFTKVLDTALETFGADRLMYGSDWPVCLLAGNYQEVLGVIQNYTSELSAAEQHKIFYQSASQFYNINN